MVMEIKLWLPSPPLLIQSSTLRSSYRMLLSKKKKEKKKKIKMCLSVSCKMIGDERKLSGEMGFNLYKWVKKNDEISRLFPVFFGGASFFLVLVNRTLSGIAPVADASSAQSRADVLSVVLSATIVLTGLVWISVKPKPLVSVELNGIQCLRMDKSLPSSVASEVMWMWEAIRNATGGKSFVIVYKDRCVLQAGLASEVEGKAKTVNSSELMQGSLCQAVLNSGKQSYLANLPLYPGRFELGFLPVDTQAVILQPLGDDGVMIVGGDTVRGFGPTDQIWISSIGDKLDATLAKSTKKVSTSSDVMRKV